MKHSSLGRLDFAELEERLTLALTAKNRSELDALVIDLPDLPTGSSRRRSRWPALLASGLAAVTVLIVLAVVLLLTL